MDNEIFRATLADDNPPAALTAALRVLWFDRSGDWQAAHGIAQDMPGADGAVLHAYLHRREGDLGNAGYWYRRAGEPVATGSLDGEWDSLVARFADESC